MNSLQNLGLDSGCFVMPEIYLPDPEVDCQWEAAMSETDYSPQIFGLLQNFPTQEDEDVTQFLPIFYQLLEKGLRRLITSAPSKTPPREVIESEALGKMSDLAPAIFIPRYRHVSLTPSP